ncbi:helix-turn-helix domain-containing protein [Acinetobacter sp. NIPH 1852]|uniref:helix-turn-helix domain-containing protein n=1 Tax=Acinetobacter sp. NIPH 1852 TaxID=2923428 RepID=UPI001F4AFCB2|nr:helix-turn-helix domain-containing protein [Acinetobacter sp. NIPH 1852]MCH7307807.1 helix-turn-helix domain-containing protein [Acinetobacter sp. NIPH 1852]
MNTAKVIQFPKQTDPQPKQEAGKSMYSDKFESGYVMSSRLYRKEVWPFLSDAARNVYAELENRINGHNKESDFVSYSQLQGGDLVGARKMGRTTVSNALQELIDLGVISVTESGKQGVKKYKLNDISIKDRFTNKTSLVTGLVSQQDQDRFTNKTETSPVTGLTIDNKNYIDNKKNSAQEKFEPQSNSMLQFIEYHADNFSDFTLRELTQTYPVRSDFIAQAQISFPKLTVAQIEDEIKRLAQWSVTAEKRTSQKWMTTWLNWLKNIETKKPKADSQKPPAKKVHRYGQGVINP